MSQIDTVFLDLDGVLCDLVRSVLRMCGVQEVERAHAAHTQFHRLARTVMAYAPQHVADDLGFESEDAVWHYVDRRGGWPFWANLSRTPWMAELMEAANSGDALVRILSTPTSRPASSHGKVQWVREHIDERAYLRLTLTREKHLLACHGRLLVDDAEHNVDAWIRAGGQAILWPQPWNRDRHVSVERALDVVREAVS